MVVDNAKQHHKAFRSIFQDWGYYPPSTVEQAALFRNEVNTVPLSALCAKRRAQFYFLRRESSFGAGNDIFLLMNSAGMTAYQICEYIFGSLKYRLTRLPTAAAAITTSFHGVKTALEELIIITSKNVVTGSF